MADTSVKLSGTYDSIEAYNILEEMRNMSADYEEIRTEAAAAASAATAASTAATNAVNTANTAVSNAQTYAGNANTSASEAAGYASDASTSATNAASSETNASNSASAAASSETNAAASETAAAASAAEAAATLQNYLPLSGGTITGNLEVSGTLKQNNENVLTSSFLSAVSVTLTGNVSANNWADFSGNITYPTGYSHALCIRWISPPSPANMTLVGWEITDSSVKVRLYSKSAYSGSFTLTLTVTK